MVVTHPAVDRVVAAPAAQLVVTGTAAQHVCIVVASQPVVAGRSNHIFDQDQRVALGVAAMLKHSLQVDLDCRGRISVAHSVITDTTIDRICPASAGKNVIAGTAA